MKVLEVYKRAYENFIRVGASESNLRKLELVFEPMMNQDVIGSFFQLKKNDNGEGLACELMFFNNEILFDIVFSVATIEHFTVLLKHLKAVSVSVTNFSSTNEKGEISKTDNLQMKITYGDSTRLYYNTDSSRFSEIIKLKDDIINSLLSKL